MNFDDISRAMLVRGKFITFLRSTFINGEEIRNLERAEIISNVENKRSISLKGRRKEECEKARTFPPLLAASEFTARIRDSVAWHLHWTGSVYSWPRSIHPFGSRARIAGILRYGFHLQPNPFCSSVCALSFKRRALQARSISYSFVKELISL